ncbi:hypothetical protein HZD78_22715 [Mycobacteroides chelonae]|uniref:hypothetical protein n=1 Tax=Mycobacteroides chelonae TaxID=1774 RepID=UPI001C48352C|nr:hypothetical protein [Mycobacteroides chelonae]MBV6362762.1 hypothetical protein [Mycobacteroides chelonae]
MKHTRILAAVAASAAVVGLSACGNDTPAAQPIPPDSNCAEVSKPVDPQNLIGNDWPWMSACDVLSDVAPAVDQARADSIVFDARQHVDEAKRHISILSTMGNKESDPEVQADYRHRIEVVRGHLAEALMDSSLALRGTPPAGFALGYTKNWDESKTCSGAMDFDKCISERPHSASPGLTGGGR